MSVQPIKLWGWICPKCSCANVLYTLAKPDDSLIHENCNNCGIEADIEQVPLDELLFGETIPD